MGLFSIGNLITLGIVALALFLYRMMDKDNRSLDKVRRYADKCKDDIAAYAEEKGAAVKDFGIALEVERKSAVELMRRLQALTEQELAAKAKSITALDERLKTYDSSLEGLSSMTGKVQENLDRIKEESGFVESVGRRVNEAKAKLEQFEKNLSALENRFERENYDTLAAMSKEITASVRSTVSDLEISAGTVERQVEEHRQAIDKIEHNRAVNVARDTEHINKVLKEALERAGSRADKMEDAALVKLRDQAQERLNILKNTWEEKIKATQETVKTKLTDIQELQKSKLTEIQEQLRVKSGEIQEQYKAKTMEIQEQLKASRDGWVNECSDIENRQKTYRDEWKKTVQELDALASEQRNAWSQLAHDAERNIIAATDARLDEYKAAQAEQYKQLMNLANDAGQLETELKRSMQDVIGRVNSDFARFREESTRNRESVEAEFDSLAAELHGKLDTVDQELAGIKNQAKENVAEKLKLFEDDFYTDLDKRNSAVENQLALWQKQFNTRIEEIAREGEEERRQMEIRFSGDQRKNIAEQSDKILGELERLKAQAGAFEEGVREQMRAADETCDSFKDQLARDLETARSSAETEINSHIGQYSLAMSETLRQNQRELEEQLRGINSSVDGWNAETEAAADAARRSIQDWQNQYSAQMRDMDTSMEEIRRRGRDMAAENDERGAQMRGDLDLIRKELAAQSKLFDQSGQLKHELERKIEDLNADMDRLDQRKNEILQIENQFLQIKRLEDDVNARMTRFLSEKRRIEVMEADFNRLLQTSQAVEEKLVQVTASDDTLQAVQVQIRRLEDSIKEADNKYQRIEKKNQILDETNDGIGRNFKALQESEASVKKANDEIVYIFSELEKIRTSIGTLAAESGKAQDAADKIAVLDEALPLLEKRIAEMQVAREWIARTETELLALDKEAQTQLRLIRSLLDRENKSGSSAGGKKGAPPIRDRENIIKLRRRGWKVDEIAKTMGISIGEVELTLEFEKLDEK